MAGAKCCQAATCFSCGKDVIKYFRPAFSASEETVWLLELPSFTFGAIASAWKSVPKMKITRSRISHSLEVWQNVTMNTTTLTIPDIAMECALKALGKGLPPSVSQVAGADWLQIWGTAGKVHWKKQSYDKLRLMLKHCEKMWNSVKPVQCCRSLIACLSVSEVTSCPFSAPSVPLQCPLSAFSLKPLCLSWKHTSARAKTKNSAVLSVFECNWNCMARPSWHMSDASAASACQLCFLPWRRRWVPLAYPPPMHHFASHDLSGFAALYCALAPKTVNLTRLLTTKIQHFQMPKIEWGNASWNERWSPLDRPMAPDGFFRLLFSTLGVRY